MWLGFSYGLVVNNLNGRKTFSNQGNRIRLDLILTRYDRNCCTMEKLRCPNSALWMKHFNNAVWSSKKVFLKQSINPVRNTYNSFTVFMQFWTSTKMACLELLEKFWLYPNRRKMVVLFMSRSYFWTVWRRCGISCFRFYFFI